MKKKIGRPRIWRFPPWLEQHLRMIRIVAVREWAREVEEVPPVTREVVEAIMNGRHKRADGEHRLFENHVRGWVDYLSEMHEFDGEDP